MRSRTSRSAPVGGLALFHNEGGGRFVNVTAKSGLPESPAAAHAQPLGLTWVDYDHDNDVRPDRPRGDTAAWAERGPEPGADRLRPVRHRQRSASGTADVAQQRQRHVRRSRRGARPGRPRQEPWRPWARDFNNDRAIDLVVTGSVHPLVWLNPREGRFKALDWPTAAQSPTIGAVVIDFDKDGWMDLAFTHAGAPGLSLWRNLEGKRVEPVTLPDLKMPAAGAWRQSITTTTAGWTSSRPAAASRRGRPGGAAQPRRAVHGRERGDRGRGAGAEGRARRADWRPRWRRRHGF